jgi:hypothetical protein
MPAGKRGIYVDSASCNTNLPATLLQPQDLHQVNFTHYIIMNKKFKAEIF